MLRREKIGRSVLTFGAVCDILMIISNWKESFHCRSTTADASSAKAIRTAGSNAEDRACGWQLSVALLVELKAQFYKLVTI